MSHYVCLTAPLGKVVAPDWRASWGVFINGAKFHIIRCGDELVLRPWADAADFAIRPWFQSALRGQ